MKYEAYDQFSSASAGDDQSQANRAQNYQNTRALIQKIYQNATKNNQPLQVLTTIFDALQQFNSQNENKNDFEPNQLIKILENKLQPSQIHPKSQLIHNPKSSYPLNKHGSFALLDRQCTIVDNGIQQRQGKKQPVIKSIVGFNNQIQSNNLNSIDQLEWIKNKNQYPFRIILKDNKNKIKGIYFKNVNDAQKIRIYYVNKFNYHGHIAQSLLSSQNIFKSKILHLFNLKLIQYQNQKQQLLSKKNSKKSLIHDSSVDKMNQKINPQNNISKNKTQIKNKNTTNFQQQYPSFQNSPLQNYTLPESSPKQSHQNMKIKQNPLTQYSNAKNRTLYQTSMIKQINNKQQQKRLNKSAFPQQTTSQQKTNPLNHKSQSSQKSFQNQSIKKYSDKNQNHLSQSKQQKQIKKTKLFQNLNDNKKNKITKIQNNYQASNKDLLQKKQGKVVFKSIQFLKKTQLFIKPFVTITFSISNTIQNQLKYNTIIQKKQPYLSYQLIPLTQPINQLSHNFNKYDLDIIVIDNLTNNQMYKDKIKLKNKVFSYQSFLSNQAKTIRLKLIYQTDRQNSPKQLKIQDNAQGCILQILPISQQITQQIRNYWQKQAMRRSYYNQNKDMKIVDIFQLFDQPPKYWALGLTELQYNIVHMLNIASKILKFKLTQSILPIMRICSKLFSQKDELIESLLSILINYLKPYYLISQFNKTNKLHKILGIDGQIQLISKINLQMQIIKKLLKIQCPSFQHYLHKKNIAYIHLLYQYIYQLFSNNFHIRILIDIWNFLFKQPSIIPIYLILLDVWIVKFYLQKIVNCHSFKQLKQILQSCQICTVDTVIFDLIKMRQKYFSSSQNNLMDSIKGIFNDKPLQQISTQFYKKQTQRFDNRRINHIIQKNTLLQKLHSQIKLQLPKYPQHSYCLHLYFYKLPQISGVLSIKTNNIDYSCLSIQTHRYFIIAQVSSQVTLQLIVNKSQIYTAKLQCMQGINKYTIELKSQKNNEIYQIQYLCGLLTNGHIQVLKKNKNFQHYLGSFIHKQQMYDQFLRSINDCIFFNLFYKKIDKDDTIKKIKSFFNNGNKNFQQIQFYLRWISISTYTLPQKIRYLKQYSSNISSQYFLSTNKQLQKLFFYQFLKIINFSITPSQFKSYYCYSIANQFQTPKIIKCRLILSNGTQYKLQHLAHHYQCNKISTHLYQDIAINQLLLLIQKQLQLHLSQINQSTLNLVYFTYGKIKNISIPIIKKKNFKDLVIDQSKFQYKTNQQNDINTAQPQLLMTETLPTFSKLSTILDFVQSTKSLQNKCKFRQTSKKLAQPINLLKYCDLKCNKVVPMRYHSYPSQLKIPFLNYFHQLIYPELQPQFPKNFYLNNLQTDLKSICVHHGKLNFFDNKRIQATPLISELGLYGNLRILPPKTQSLYFVTIFSQQQLKPNALYFTNYGYGIYQWQPCIVLHYTYLTKISNKSGSLKQKEQKSKKYYLIKFKNKSKYCQQHQIKIHPHVQDMLEEVNQFQSFQDISDHHGNQKNFYIQNDNQ